MQKDVVAGILQFATLHGKGPAVSMSKMHAGVCAGEDPAVRDGVHAHRESGNASECGASGSGGGHRSATAARVWATSPGMP